MSNAHDPMDPRDVEQTEAPELVVIGRADQVVLGMPGKGFDGEWGIDFTDFEFEPDDKA